MGHPRLLVAPIILALTAALLGGTSPAAAADSTASTGAAQPTSAGPDVTHATSALTAAAPARSAARRGGKWPAKRVTAVTTQDWLNDDPTPADAQQLASASLTQDVVRGTFSATVTLKAAPTASTDSWVRIAFGKTLDDGITCASVGGDGGSNVWWRAHGEDVPGLTRDGATMKLTGFAAKAAGRDRFDCAFAETWEVLPEDAPANQEMTYYSGHGDYSLTRHGVDKPKFKVKAPKKTAAKVNRWQKIKVKVRNTNPRVAAPGVKVKVKGKKIATKTKKIGKLSPGKTKRVTVKFRVKPGHRGKAKIVVTSKNVAARKKIRLR